MLINNINIKNYNARVLDIDIQNSSFSNAPEWVEKSLLPNFKDSVVTLNTITVNLLMDSKDKHSNFLDRSNLLGLMIGPFNLYFTDRKLQFKAVLAEQQNKQGIKDVKGTLQLHIYAYCFEDERVENLDRVYSKDITVVGNTTTPAVVEITPTLDIIDITIQGLADDPIKIKNLSKNKTVIIDGEAGLITENGINKFDDTDMWEFPRLTPGNNHIKLSRNDCNIKIKYKARYF